MSKIGHQSITVNVRTDVPTKVTVHVTPQIARKNRLKMGSGNAKLDRAIATFSLPAGWFCPFAKDCKSKSSRKDGTIQDGPHTQFRCYAATNAARARSVRDARWHNAKLLKGKSKRAMTELLLASISPYVGYLRMHVSGDYFSQAYFDAWLEFARQRPRTLCYGYTKALPYLVKRLKELPPNFILTASYGGTHDHLIEQHGLRYARVVYSEQEAADLGLELDHRDEHAMDPAGPSFALLVHGTQPAGTEAAAAVASLRTAGEFGYGERADKIRRERGRVPLELLF